MPKIYGVARPQPLWHIVWDGDNIQEIKDAFHTFPSSMFFVNEENGNLCFGITVEDANQYPVGTLMFLMGGVGGMSQEAWDAQYSNIDIVGPVKYDVSAES